MDSNIAKRVPALAGRGHVPGLRDPARQVQRNGYRGRAWDTRAGRIDLETPACAREATSHPHWSLDGPLIRHSRR
jgi:hypothetical protein